MGSPAITIAGSLLLGSAAGWIGAGLDAWKNSLHVLVRRALEPCIRCPRGVMLAKHIGDGLRIHVLRHDEKAVCLVVMADGLLMKALLSQLAGFHLLRISLGTIPPAVRQGMSR
jgi:hypothetical protein